jgi:DNA helicase II / ATP-dependent DNA helicase PcrA
VYLVFLRLLSRQNYYTFEDQILFALAILRSRPDIVHEYQHFYEYILVDELQDFTPAQVQLFLRLCREKRHILAFGDRDQEVRVKKTGAASVFGQFSEMDSCGSGNSHHLSTNFRSTQHILDLVDHLRNFQMANKRPRLLSAYGSDGEFPIMLYVRIYDNQHDDMSLSYEEGIRAIPPEIMVQAAIEQMERIPETERGSVALIAAKSSWSLSIERYLKSQKLHFSVLSTKSLYQLHHVERFLVYLRLIIDPGSDNDVGWFLRNSLVPYFENSQVEKLKTIAKQLNRSLFDLLAENKVFNMIQVAAGQQVALEQHLTMMKQFRFDSLVGEVEKALKTIENNPIAVIAEQGQKREDVATVLKDLRLKTVTAALVEIKQHISFLGEEQKHTGLIATTVDHAKSEEFDTVFLIGADYIPQPMFPNIIDSYRRRLYVSTSRARQRLFLVVNGNGPTRNPILASIPGDLYSDVVWTPQRSENDVPV